MSFLSNIWNWILGLFKSTPSAPIVIYTSGAGPGLNPTSGWQITHSSLPVPPVSNNGFDFPLAANADVAWVSYFELPFTEDISQKSTISITYTLTGDNPVFDHTTPNNVSTGPSAVYLMLHRAGDPLSGAGSYAYYRWFGPILKNPPDYPLQLGTHTITVPLTLTSWGSLADQQELWFHDAKANLGSIGVVFGGGDFYSHGVCVTSGSAHFTIDSYIIT